MTVILLGIAGAGKISSGAGGGLGTVPFLVYAAAPAIFPVMTFFLWQDRDVYRPFSSLYIAGKLISIVAVVIWCYFNWSLNALVLFARFSPGRDILFQFTIPLLSLLDVLSIFGIFTSSKE